jgi:hypothetical protein
MEMFQTGDTPSGQPEFVPPDFTASEETHGNRFCSRSNLFSFPSLVVE